MSRPLVPALLLTACCAAAAQSPQPAQDPAVDGRRNQRVERIVHEDGGSRIEELRVGGETQSITVQPKADVPAYEVAPATPSRSRVADERGGSTGGAGQRSWNVFRF